MQLDSKRNTELSASMHMPTLFWNLKRVKNSLPQSSSHKWVELKFKVKNVSQAESALSDDMKEQTDNLLSQNDTRRDSDIYLGKIDGVAQFVPKQYLIWTF